MYSDSEMTNSSERQQEEAPRRPGKRERLVAAASQLLHQQGIEKTTLVEIAQAADVPAGNVYYYFKTKDEIITAVIDAHIQYEKAMLASIDARHRSPKTRLKALVGELMRQGDVIVQFGCPLGSLCSELDKRAGGPSVAAAELMRIPIAWAEEQFRSLDQPDAHDLAVSLLASYEGTALLTNTLRDPKILAREARRLERWIDAL
jgi:TetR/AcrR family transcriptional regulator, transcriptional repressor for nem operon